jgi:ribulose-phosphate 3-epimerase
MNNEIDEGQSPKQVLSVGVLSADLMNLGKDLAILEEYGIQMLHFDCMDGHFAPSLTIGAPFVKAITTSMYKDVHLMVSDPIPLIADFVAAGADMITVHAESTPHIHRALQMISEMKNVNDSSRAIVRGLALNPGTSLAAVEPLLDEVEVVFLVAINPAFPKQQFIDATKRKVEMLREMIDDAGKSILIGIDGGVTKKNIAKIASMGPDIIVTGSAVFENGTIKENLDEMYSHLNTEA